MEALHVSTSDNLLPNSTDMLYQNVKDWHSALIFYKTEIDFIQKLLDRYALSIDQHDDMAVLEQVQNKIFYYQGEVLDDYIARVKDLEKSLGKVVAGLAGEQDRNFREIYDIIQDEVNSFGIEYRVMKNNIFQLVEKII